MSAPRKFNDEQTTQIANRFQDGESIASISRDLEANTSTVADTLRRGGVVTGQRGLVPFRLHQEQLAAIDQRAADLSMTRSDVIREALAEWMVRHDAR